MDQLASELQVSWKKQFQWLEAKTKLENEEVFLVKPQTWMNLSGEAVAKIVGHTKSSLENLIVVHDELDLDLGVLRWVFESGHGGHNGVRSIIDQLSTKAFNRLRLGVGRPPKGSDPADYVLNPFSRAETEAAKKLTIDATESIRAFLKHGLQWVQNHYH